MSEQIVHPLLSVLQASKQGVSGRASKTSSGLIEGHPSILSMGKGLGGWKGAILREALGSDILLTTRRMVSACPYCCLRKWSWHWASTVAIARGF